jgi:hypothetical protein
MATLGLLALYRSICALKAAISAGEPQEVMVSDAAFWALAAPKYMPVPAPMPAHRLVFRKLRLVMVAIVSISLGLFCR